MWRNLIQNDLGVDLGTANTLIYRKGQGIVLNEPSVVAVNRKTDRIVAVGKTAKDMLGRTPQHIEVVRPLVDGVISDFEMTEEMLSHFFAITERTYRRLLPPRVVICVPSNITNVESRAVRDAARNAGARVVHVVEEPMAAAIGVGLPVLEATGSMIVDIGGGTSDIAVISLGGVVASRNLRYAGDHFNRDIVSFIRDRYKLLIGEQTAENAKIKLFSISDGEERVATVRGRDVVSGLPRAIAITDEDVRSAIAPSIKALVESIKDVLEQTPPELLADIMRTGISLVGGGATINGLDDLLSELIEVPFVVDGDPLTAVVRGTGVILEDFKLYQPVLVPPDHAIVPQATE